MPPFSIAVSETLRSADPKLQLGLLLAEVQIAPRGEALDQTIEAACTAFRARETPDSIKTWPSIRDARQVYKALGKDPSRYRPSAEALLRRVVSGKSLYRINNAVDLLNLVSLESGYSIGGYDADAIEGPIRLERGAADPYEAIGRGNLNVEGLPVLYDARGPFGSPTSDSTRTMVGPETRRFLWVLFGFGAAEHRQWGSPMEPKAHERSSPEGEHSGPAVLEPVLQRAGELLAMHASGKVLDTRIQV
jgi:DNA/RNA-binding domain of Phe-tRNA-synthetase-like protein